MDPEQTKPERSQRLWKVILVLSLALNVAILGAVLGATWRSQDDGRRLPALNRDIGSLYLRALGPEHRRELGRKLRPSSKKGKAARAEIAQGFEQAIAVLRAEPFDRTALEQIMQDHAQRSELRMQEARAVLLDHLIRIGPDERAAYADRIEKFLKGGASRKP